MDHCERCSARGNLKQCMSTPCAHHDSWMAVTLKMMLRQARDTIDQLPGYPKGAELCDQIDQTCGDRRTDVWPTTA